MDWSFVLLLVSDVCIAFALGCCLRIPRPRSRFFNALLLVLGLDLFTEMAGLFIVWQGHYNTALYNVCMVLEFLLVLRLFAMQRPARIRFLAVTALLGIGAWVWSWSRWRSLNFLLTEGFSVAGLLITGWAVVLLWRLSEESRIALGKVPSFWVLTAMLVFFGALFPVIGPLRVIYADSPILAGYLYTIVNLLSIARYGLIAYGCILEARAGQRPLGE